MQDASSSSLLRNLANEGCRSRQGVGLFSSSCSLNRSGWVKPLRSEIQVAGWTLKNLKSSPVPNAKSDIGRVIFKTIGSNRSCN